MTTPGSLVVVISYGVFFLFTYSLRENNIGDAGAQALAEGLQRCTNLLKLK